MSIKALKYQITMNPQQSITDLFINDSIFNDIDINNFSRSLGITGRLDYSKYLKYQLIANVRTNYLDRAIIELHQLQRLSLISGRYVKVNKYGFPLKLDSKTVFKLLKKLLNRYKSMKEAKSSYGC